MGGERWWQVRGINGVEAEWVAMKSDWQRIMREKKKGRTADDVYDASIDRLDRVMVSHFVLRFLRSHLLMTLFSFTSTEEDTTLVLLVRTTSSFHFTL